MKTITLTFYNSMHEKVEYRDSKGVFVTLPLDFFPAEIPRTITIVVST